MKKIMFLIVFLLTIITVSALTLPKAPPLEEQTVPEGQNATLSLTIFTRALLRTYEGSRVDFNVYNEKTRALEAVNSIIVTEVKPDSIDVLLSLDGSTYEKKNMKLGEMLTINYTDKSIPFMFLEVQKLRYFEDENGNLIKHTTLFFNVPAFSVEKLPEPPKEVDVTNVIPVEEENKNNNWIYYILGILVLVVAIVWIKKSK